MSVILADITRDHITKVLESGSSKVQKILIVDDITVKILGSVISLKDVLLHHVSLVEKIRSRSERSPLPAFDAIYFISPTMENLQILAEDFPDSKENMYRRFYLFFSHRISSQEHHNIVEFMRNGANTWLKYMKTFDDSCCEVLPVDTNIFVLPTQFQLNDLKSLNDQLLNTIASQLTSMITAVEGNWAIISSNSEKYLSRNLKTKMNNLMNCSSTPDSIFMIVDRREDHMTPLMHTLSYEALLYDMIGIDPITKKIDIKGQFLNKQTTKARVDNDFFYEQRFRNIFTASMYIEEALNAVKDQFSTASAALDERQRAKLGFEAQKAEGLIKEHFQYLKKMINKYAVNNDDDISILAEVAVLEQEINGFMRINGNVSEEKLAPVLGNPNLDPMDKKRLLLCMANVQEHNQGVFNDKNDFETFLNANGFGALNEGGKLSRAFQQVHKLTNIVTQRSRGYFDPTDAVMTPTYSSFIEKQIDLVKRGSMPEDYSISPRSGALPIRNRLVNLVVFVIGGISPAEFYVSDEEVVNVFIGGTTIVTPKAYVEQLEKM
eukprot:TRINITY_DN3052_c2_g1_i1.p1 TRINITY_DN3052_c2_g1~~TRINITY_DN3052_c2_g1_i1.p1  ORF type:complete len:550 (+),score=157.00 TRINITY_DN3052_c2_g1_i1:1524-3173(+)